MCNDQPQKPTETPPNTQPHESQPQEPQPQESIPTAEPIPIRKDTNPKKEA